jgi:phytoene synthase
MSDAPDIETSDLDALVSRVDPDRWLSSRFVADEHRRADVVALYAFDHELGRAPKVASNALLGEIRLTWWSEVLEQIFENRPIRRHPTAEALAHAVKHWSLPRAPLEAMIEARFRELDPAPMTPEEAAEWAAGTAGNAAVLAALALDPTTDAEAARAAGQAWALSIRQARRAANAPDLGAVLKAARRQASADVKRLSIAAFPAAAHGALAGGRTRSEAGKRLRLTWAVAVGRI